jgi:CheY-like chemotaxis protein
MEAVPRTSPRASALAPTAPAPLPTNVPALLAVADPDTRLLVKGLLRLLRHPVRAEAADAEELERLPTVDETTVVLLEVDPTFDGWEPGLRAIVHRHPLGRTIVLSPRVTPEFTARARAAGARAVLARPFAIRELSTALAAALDGAPRPGRGA